MEKLATPLEKFKEELINDIDFIIGGREQLTNEEKSIIAKLINARIAIYSHEIPDCGLKGIGGYVNHKMRENQRKELKQFVTKYILDKKVDKK